MTMINCPECGHAMSSTATACPNCGHVMATRERDEDVHHDTRHTATDAHHERRGGGIGRWVAAILFLVLAVLVALWYFDVINFV